MSEASYLIVTDLDGSLLDDSYQWQEAKPALELIRKLGIPLILNSSKTFAELQDLAEELDLGTPVICENGGIVGVPEQSPLAGQLSERAFMGYRMMYPGISREYILQVAHRLREKHGYPFKGFHDWTDQEVADLTGLETGKAALARRRHATEPILWYGKDDELLRFTAELANQGIRIVKGGQFLHLMGQVNKAEGMRLVQHLYRQTQPEISRVTFALGDSANDLEMLSAAEIAGVIPDHDGQCLAPEGGHVLVADHRSSQGWNQLVLHILNNRIGM